MPARKHSLNLGHSQFVDKQTAFSRIARAQLVKLYRLPSQEKTVFEWKEVTWAENSAVPWSQQTK